MNRMNHLRIAPENADRPFAARLRAMSPDLITLRDVRMELCGDTLATVTITEEGRFAGEFLIETIGADRDMDGDKWQGEERALYAVEGPALDSPGARGRQFFTRDQLTRLALTRRLCEDGMLRARFCIVNDAGPTETDDGGDRGPERGARATETGAPAGAGVCIANSFLTVNNYYGYGGDIGSTDQCAPPWTSPGRLHAIAGQGKGHAAVQPGRGRHGQGNGQKQGL